MVMIKYKILSNFIFVLLIMASYCYAENSKQRLDVKKHLKSFNKYALKSIKHPDGNIIDCVDIYKQPAFDHPSLKNHTIQMRPSFQPKEESLRGNITFLKSKKNDPKTITQLWHNSGSCPEGTIPIRRAKEEDVLIASSIKSFGRKNRTNTINPKADIGEGHEYAIAYVRGDKYFGTKAILNLWKPHTQQPYEFSISQIWLTNGPFSSLNSVEAGWIVSQHLFGDINPRFFTFWTSDGYKKTGCFNLWCAGFVQTNNKILLGGALKPISGYQSTQFDITILIYKDPNSGHWWLQYQNILVGYWPSSLFSYLKESATVLQWGGEVINLKSGGQHTTTEMGSGHFPDEGYGKASFIKNIEIVDGSNKLYVPAKLSLQTTNPNCYNIQLRKRSKNWGSFFYYGGPGRNPKCP